MQKCTSVFFYVPLNFNAFEMIARSRWELGTTPGSGGGISIITRMKFVKSNAGGARSSFAFSLGVSEVGTRNVSGFDISVVCLRINSFYYNFFLGSRFERLFLVFLLLVQSSFVFLCSTMKGCSDTVLRLLIIGRTFMVHSP